VVDGTKSAIDDSVPLAPEQLEQNGWTLRFVAGVQARL
jgi:hypothetical protein